MPAPKKPGLLNTLTSWLGRKRPAARPAKPATFRPAMEHLESREVPSAAVRDELIRGVDEFLSAGLPARFVTQTMNQNLPGFEGTLGAALDTETALRDPFARLQSLRGVLSGVTGPAGADLVPQLVANIDQLGNGLRATAVGSGIQITATRAATASPPRLAVGGTPGFETYFSGANPDPVRGTATDAPSVGGGTGTTVVFGVDGTATAPSFYVDANQTRADYQNVRATFGGVGADRVGIGSLRDSRLLNGTLTATFGTAGFALNDADGRLRRTEFAGATARSTVGGTVTLNGTIETRFRLANESSPWVVDWNGTWARTYTAGAPTDAVELTGLTVQEVRDAIAGPIGTQVEDFIVTLPLFQKLDEHLNKELPVVDRSVNQIMSGVSSTFGAEWPSDPAQLLGNWLGRTAAGAARAAAADLITLTDDNGANSVQALMRGQNVTLFEKTFAGGQPVIVNELDSNEAAVSPVFQVGDAWQAGDKRFEYAADAPFAWHMASDRERLASLSFYDVLSANLYGSGQGGVRYMYDLTFGVDTNGLYLTDTSGVAVNGQASTTLEGTIEALGIDLAKASGTLFVGLDGWVRVGDVGANRDGRLHVHEIARPGDSAGDVAVNFLDALDVGFRASTWGNIKASAPIVGEKTIYELPQDRAKVVLSARKAPQAPGTSRGGSPVAVARANGVVTITGTADGDRVELSQSGTNLLIRSVFTNAGREEAREFAEPLSGLTRVVFNGNAGNDTLVVTPTLTVPIEANGGAGNDDLSGGAGADTLRGGAVGFVGEDGNDILRGWGGNDRLEGGTGSDLLRGGAGLDTLLGGAGGDELYGGTENDLLEGGEGTDELYGEAGDDRLFGFAEADPDGSTDFDQLEGGAGNDTLTGSAGSDRLLGQAGNDVLTGGTGADEMDGGTGNDTLLGGAGADLLYGDAGADRLEGGAENDYLAGGTENDTLLGGAADDVLDGGAGHDVLEGDENSPTVVGNDRLYGWDGNDTLRGFAGNDWLVGGLGSDVVEGGSGTDTLEVSAEETAGRLDRLDGGTDVGDELLFLGSSDADTITLTAAGTAYTLTLVAPGRPAATISFTLPATIERMRIDAGAGDDTVRATAAALPPTILEGNDGNDTLYGGAANDVLYGGAGSDQLFGGAGNDVLRGMNEAGTAADGADLLDGGAGDDLLYGDGGDDTLRAGTGRDDLFGGDGHDRLEAGTDIYGDRLDGGIGNDTLIGGAGKDNLFGGIGNDILLGGDLGDLLEGGADNDLLAGEAGRDIIRGDGGNDTLFALDDPATRAALGLAPIPVLTEAERNALLTAINARRNELIVVRNRLQAIPEASRTAAQQAELTAAQEQINLINETEIDLHQYAATHPDQLFGGSGDDTLRGSAGVDHLYGESGNDTIVHSAGADLIRGDGGDGPAGRDVYLIEGTELDDTITVAATTMDQPVTVTVNGQATAVQFAATASIDVVGVRALGGNDSIRVAFTVSPVELLLDGGAGNDTLDARTTQGRAELLGGAGNDTLMGGAANDLLRGGGDNDTLFASGGWDTIDGGTGTDTFRQDAQAAINAFTVANGGLAVNGNAVLMWPGSNFERLELNGGTGNDTFTSDGTALRALGSATGVTEYQFNGGAGNDRFEVLPGAAGATSAVAHHLNGGTVSGVFVGNTFRLGLSGTYTVNRGAAAVLYATDTLTLEGDDTANTFALSGTGHGLTATGYMAVTAEGVGSVVVDGRGGNDTINASAAARGLELRGGDGNDTLTGGAGGDVLDGGTGNDLLYGRGGSDVLYGGTGNDSLFGGTVGWLAVDQDTSADYLYGGADDDTLDGGNGNDVLNGDGGNDWLYGVTGNDTLSGGAGNDYLYGGADDDLLNGGDGNDYLYGESGNDRLFGNAGADNLQGGAGDDELDGGADRERDVLRGGAGRDRFTVHDYTRTLVGNEYRNAEYLDTTDYGQNGDWDVLNWGVWLDPGYNI